MGLLRVHQTQIVQVNGDVRIFIAVGLLIDCERAPIERFGFGKAALHSVEQAKIIEINRDRRIGGTE